MLYLAQEGRGIGLLNKLRAYELQEQGRDTVDANTELGFKPDLREYGIGAQILADLGLSTIQILTNNPRKIIGLEGYGLKVTKQVPIEVEVNEHSLPYMTREARQARAHPALAPPPASEAGRRPAVGAAAGRRSRRARPGMTAPQEGARLRVPERCEGLSGALPRDARFALVASDYHADVVQRLARRRRARSWSATACRAVG